MTSTLKTMCLAIYLLGIDSALGALPPTLDFFGWVAGALFVAHVLEIPVAFRYIKRYPGPLATSIVLTLLFGFLHWLPLRKQAAH